VQIKRRFGFAWGGGEFQYAFIRRVVVELNQFRRAGPHRRRRLGVRVVVYLAHLVARQDDVPVPVVLVTPCYFTYGSKLFKYSNSS
jgi:hypothetical protein